MSIQTSHKPKKRQHTFGLNFRNFRNEELKHFYLISAAILTFFPFWLMFVVSFKTLPQFYQNVLSLDFPLNIANYALASKVVTKYIFNSIIKKDIKIKVGFTTQTLHSPGASPRCACGLARSPPRYLRSETGRGGGRRRRRGRRSP